MSKVIINKHQPYLQHQFVGVGAGSCEENAKRKERRK